MLLPAIFIIGRFLEFRKYHNFSDFYLNCQKAPVICTIISFTKKYKV